MSKLEEMKDEFIPLYHSLKQILRAKISSGEWKIHQRIPSEHELMEQYGVSRATVRQALADLAAEGLIYRRQGKGTFVAPPKIEQALLGFYSFTEEMRRQGLTPSSRVLFQRIETAQGSIARSLGIPEGSEIVVLSRLRLANDEPIILETSFMPHSLFPGLAEMDLSSTPLYDIFVNHYSIRPMRAVETFEPVLVDEFEAKMLGVKKGSPALLVRQTTYDGQGQVIEFCKGIVRGDRSRYYVELTRG